ncbi:MAG: class I SAM-dependent methyltransferase [Bacteroidales bacterium]|nr:MAG: class I SAM-dependent methyltransferase [Bacteroidales bacterium]
MDIEEFFELLLKEIEVNTSLQNLYRFLKDKRSYHFRKAYYLQRLEYVKNNITLQDASIWDCGCGYGTTGFFLALNGYNVHGTTVEYFYDHIPERFEYWSKFGDTSRFSVSYQNLFDAPFFKDQFDYVITQDVLHHVEPNDRALQIIKDSMKDTGILIACEENGNNLINNFKLFLRRGNKRVIDIYDEKLKKHLKLGNENIQSLKSWKRKLRKAGMAINDNSIEYIRLFPPFFFNKDNYKHILERENRIWKRNKTAREFLFFGINFTAGK